MAEQQSIIKVIGGRPLHGSEYAIIPDQIEAGTYMAAVAATGGQIRVRGIIPKHMDCITAKLVEMGIVLSVSRQIPAARAG